MAIIELIDPGQRPGAPDETPTVFPCTLAQQRFWVLDRIDPGTAALNVAVRWRLEGDVSAELAERAFAAIIARHETLRTAIVEQDGTPVQVVAQAVPFRLPDIDLTRLEEAQRMPEALRLGAREARAPFDLTRPPLLRATLLRLEPRVSILLVTVHHVVADGWSIGVLAREFGRQYDAVAAGNAPDLPELEIQYGDFALWQQAWLASEALTPAREFWQQRLAGLAPFEVPPDKPRPPVQTDNGAIVSVVLPRPLTDALAALGRTRGATMYATSLAGLLTLLHRYTGQTDIVLGTQVAGRDQVELEPLVGNFINTVILRHSLDPSRRLAEVLEETRDTVQDALAHQQMPIEELIARIRPARDLSRNALFSVNFIFQRAFIRNESFRDFALVDIPSQTAGALYDLNFFMVERPDGWRMSCEYNIDLFEQSTVEGMLAALRTVFAGMVADPAATVGGLRLMTAEEEAALVGASNDTARDYPADRTLTELVSARAAAMGGAMAVAAGERQLSHAELEAASNRLARHLQERGVGVGTRVGICLQRSTDLLTALVAVMKAGAAYVPLDPAYPATRLQQIVDDADLTEIVTSTPAWRQLAHDAARVTMLDWDSAQIAGQDDAPLPQAAGPDDVAYVIFTSGSTGRPKGVQVTHRNLVNLLCAMAQTPGLAAGETLVSVTTVSFDIAGLELFLPLLVGARLVIASAEEAADGAALLGLLRKWNANVLQATPVTWEMLIEAGWNGDPRLRALCGGEALGRPLADRILARAAELWNMYGPTETTIWSSTLKIEPGEGPVPIGPPIANTQFHVLDARGEPTPLGAIGELYIGGDGVAAGYFGRPDLTRERFVADTRGPLPGRKMYRTGDLVRRRPNGTVEFLGRADNQVKLRGFRIELGEIEAALLSHPQVAAGVVVLRKNAAGDGMLCAYVVAAGVPVPGLPATLTRALAGALPAHMVPASVTVLPALPRTPNGKIDRNALPEPARAQAAAPVVAPAGLTDVERQIAEIWSDVLGTKVDNADANFFELGGHSLLAARMLARVTARFGEKLPFTTLFRAPVLGQFARLVPERGAVAQADQLVWVQPRGQGTPVIAIYNTGIFHTLANRIGPDRPFLAVQLCDPHEPCALPEGSFEDLAAAFVRLIRAARPHGPYVLLGLCVAGTIAYEAAQQLRAAGEEVELLVLIDGWAPGYLRRRPVVARWLADMSYRWKVLHRQIERVWSGHQTFAQLAARMRLVRTLRLLPMARALGLIKEIPADAPDQWMLDHFGRALASYEPRSYGGRALVFHSLDQPSGGFLDTSLGWAELCTGPFTCENVPGDHLGLFQDPGASQMAARIGALLRDGAEANDRPAANG